MPELSRPSDCDSNIVSETRTSGSERSLFKMMATRIQRPNIKKSRLEPPSWASMANVEASIQKTSGVVT